MRRPLCIIAGAVVCAAAVGTASALRWIQATAAAGAETAWSAAISAFALPVAVLLALAGLAALRTAIACWTTVSSRRIALPASLLAAISAYLALTFLFQTLSTADPRYPTWLATAFVAVAVAAAAMKRIGLAVGLLLASAVSIESTGSLRAVVGDDLAVASLAYAPLAPVSHYVSIAVPLVVLGAMAGLAWALLTRSGGVRSTAAGLAVGAATALCVCWAQTTTYLAAMGSGQDPASILRVSTITWIALVAAVVMAVLGASGYRRLRAFRLAPAIVLVALAEYAFIACYGAAEFHSLSLRGRDGTFAYVHFRADGTWHRTLDERASAARTENARRFLSLYPYSAYRPAAMLAAAEGDYAQWNFDEASQLLRKFEREYPVLDGYGSVLLVMSDLAAGREAAMFRPAADGSRFATWRLTQGAQMAAAAAEKLGQPVRARGLHSAYIDYLLSRPGASWTSRALAFSRARLESLTPAPRRPLETATVRVRVMTDTGPLTAARIALVQPRPDAALPSDSSRFTGAWTIPAWNGQWGVVDEEGRVTIRNVPFGEYEVVLGLDFKTARKRYVVRAGVPAVRVAAASVDLAPIRLVPAVHQTGPQAGAELRRSPVLSWEPYPGATSYAVSVVSLSGRQRGSTCWTRSGVSTTRASLDAAHFVNGGPRLAKGRAYMWIVYAYGAGGKLLSSSEHYFDLRERTFVVN